MMSVMFSVKDSVYTSFNPPVRLYSRELELFLRIRSCLVWNTVFDLSIVQFCNHGLLFVLEWQVYMLDMFLSLMEV